jgi:sphingomyelin phosphodiesterase
MEPDIVCGLVLQGECGGFPSTAKFSINIDKGPANQNQKTNINSNAKDFKILHFTDIHYDPDYLVNGTADCAEPLCCKKQKGLSKKPEKAAGYWGDYRSCDTPWHSVENALDQISKHIEVTIPILSFVTLSNFSIFIVGRKRRLISFISPVI